MAWRIAGILLGVWLVVGVVLGLAACASDRPPAPPPAVSVQCLPLKGYTAAQEAAAARELATLPPGSALAVFIADYGAMRDADRACIAGQR